MIGQGKLVLSHSTVIEALQEWLDKRWTVDSPVVRNVDKNYNGAGGVAQFEIVIQSNKEYLGVTEPIA